MTNQGETFQRVTVAEASRRLGVSVATVRQRIRAGELEAETAIRPQGTAFMVRLPVDASAGDSDAYPRDQALHDMTRTQASPEQALVSLIQATIGTILEPLLAEMTAVRQASERKDQALRELERENGRQAAELETLRASQAPQDAQQMASTPPMATEPAPTWWRHFWPLLALLLVMLVGVLVLLANR